MFVLASSSLIGWGCEHPDPTGLGVHPGQGSLLYRGLISWPHSPPSSGLGVVLTLKNAARGRGGGGVDFSLPIHAEAQNMLRAPPLASGRENQRTGMDLRPV